MNFETEDERDARDCLAVYLAEQGVCLAAYNRLREALAEAEETVRDLQDQLDRRDTQLHFDFGGPP